MNFENDSIVQEEVGESCKDFLRPFGNFLMEGVSLFLLMGGFPLRMGGGDNGQ